jgi:uncharacterized membrane protein
MAPRSSLHWIGVLLGAAPVGLPTAARAQTVHAVLFHSPTCPHCRQVISQDLPVFFDVYGGAPEVTGGAPGLALVSNGTLAILFVDAANPAGGPLFDASFESHTVGAERRGVPRMIVGDEVMIGSLEIPGRLHGIIRAGLAKGGIPWPRIPGLDQATARLEHPGVIAPQTAQTPQRPDSARAADTTAPAPGQRPPAAVHAAPAESAAIAGTTAPADTAASRPAASALEAIGTESETTIGQRFRRDPIGNGLALLGLGLMVLTLAAVGSGVPARVGPREPGLWLPLLAVAGAGVAAYLTYVETSGATAICGPVGDCNTVQQSAYATLFGVLPVGALGLAGYGLVIILWVLGQDGRPTASLARRLLVAAALIGTLFSVYLTVLEPFVIGATCMWCLTSAVVMTALLWLAAAWRRSSGPHTQAS